MNRPTHAYCPACREDSAIDVDRRCLWCGGETRERKHGGWKRLDLRGSKYSEVQLRALYKAHIEDGRSINDLAKVTYERVGYGSHASAATAIGREWKQLGLPARDRIEQVKRTCTVHGLAPKHGPRPGYGTYKRRQKRPDQPLCEGLRTQHPRKGEPCQRPAMFGSRFCVAHDPTRKAEIVEHLRHIRASLPERELVPLEPFRRWLHERHDELGSFYRVASACGLHPSQVYCWKDAEDTNHKPKHSITVEVVRRALEFEGSTTFEELYAAEGIAA